MIIFVLGVLLVWIGNSFTNMAWATFPTHIRDLQDETRLILFVWFLICVAIMFGHWSGDDEAEGEKKE